jgi:hypothetical protein
MPTVNQNARIAGAVRALALTAMSAATLIGGDPYSYRGFQLGMNVVDAQKRAGGAPSQLTVLHRRPALIQQLEWRPVYIPGAEPDSVKEVFFSFYNGELFRISVNYDRYRTEGLTAEDLIGAISATYGTTERPRDEAILASSYPFSYGEKSKVIARWEDSKNSFSLARLPFQPGFVLVGISKRLDDLAQAAAVEASRLDAQEAPEREAEQRRRQAEETAAKQEKARLANMPGFRP